MTRMLLAACMLLYHTSWWPVCYHTIRSTELRLALLGGPGWRLSENANYSGPCEALFISCYIIILFWRMLLQWRTYIDIRLMHDSSSRTKCQSCPASYIWMLCLMNVGVIAVMEEQGEGRASHWRGSSLVGDGQNPGDVNCWSTSYRCLRWTVWATAQGRPCAGMMLWVCGAAAVYHLEVHYWEHKCGPCTEYWRC